MQTIFKLLTNKQIKLTILISILFFLILSVTVYSIYFYSIMHYKSIANNLFQITKYYLQIEHKRAENLTQKLTQKHNELAYSLINKTFSDTDSFLKVAKKELEYTFGRGADIAIINNNLIITDTTFKSEKGLDLKQFEDAAKLAKEIKGKKDPSYVDITFPVYTPASNSFKIYTFSYLPEIDNFLQIGISFDYLKVFSGLTNYDNDIKLSLLYAGGGDYLDVFDVANGKKVIIDKKLETSLMSDKNEFVTDTFFLKSIYYKISQFNYGNIKMSGNIILKISIFKKNIYKFILIILALEILIFTLLFLSIRDTYKFYRLYFFRPFKHILAKIRKGEFIQEGESYKVKELYYLSKNYNKILSELLAKQNELKQAMDEIKTLKELLPICSSCKKIRTENNDWEHIETYLAKSHNLDFTHSLCPECIKKLYPEVAEKMFNKK